MDWVVVGAQWLHVLLGIIWFGNSLVACRDARIVSYRRAAFYAAVARGSGETADRVVPAESGWRIPAVVAAGLDLLPRLPDGVESRAPEPIQLATATLTERSDR